MGGESGLKSREVSAMIKQGFIPDPTLSFSPSRTFSPPPSSTRPSQTQAQTHPQHTQTLFDMMSEEHKFSDDKRRKAQDRLSKLLREPALREGGEVRLTVVGRDGLRVSMEVRKSVLADKSRFFAEKLRCDGAVSHSVEISDCDDVEVYVEAVVLMHCEDLKARLRSMGDGVPKVLSLLKVSAAIMFDVGVVSCLEYLESIPWSEDEQEEVISQVEHLQIHDSAAEVLQRVSSDPSTADRADDIFLNLISGVLQAKDDKARREMKALLSKLLKENNAPNDSTRLDVSKDTLYHLCHKCISSLLLCLSEATGGGDERPDRGVVVSDITREADNIQWIVDILIGKKIGEEFVEIWAEQKELAALHSKVPTVYRHEISRITAQLCIGIGRGHILVPKETRFSLLSTWLEALYEDFGWMRRASRAVDRKLVEDGLSQTILTLPLLQQQAVLLNWFDRFLNKGDDCPNIQKAFEIWWRRAFIRQYSAEPDNNSQLQITLSDYPS
ncbi:hypothetical protein DEO72_LG3g2834 [Vigna unguiculata]|uniref:At3g05675-like ankyrin-like domain-containing protein n=1 Tax=Vigna unguiculata TaxID=3917 RepID=A0A4D6LI04_VIGUN|nr:hypothetical protein DEO72_LG3g2834 [Vigna unguiculata]